MKSWVVNGPMTDTSLASSFPDYTAFAPLLAALALAIMIGIGALLWSTYGHGNDEQKARYRKIGRKLVFVALAWLLISGIAALIVTSSS